MKSCGWRAKWGFTAAMGWGAMRFACCWRSMALRAAGRALDARAIENTLRKGRPIIEYVGPGYFTGSGHYVVLRGIAANGELLVADPNSEENTLHKTYRFAEMLRQAKGDYPFMICDQIDAPEEATAGETKAITKRRAAGSHGALACNNQFIQNFCRT